MNLIVKRARRPLFSKFAVLCSVLLTAGLVQVNSGVLANSGAPAEILSVASQTFDFGLGDCSPTSLDARGGFFFVGAQRAGCNMQDWSAVSKLSFDGTKYWTVNFGTQYSWLANVEALSNGGVAVVGMTGGSVFGQTHSAGDWDAFIVVLDSSGQLSWAKQFGGNGTTALFDVEETEAGNLIAVGISESDFVGAPNHGGQDGLLVSYSQSGVQQWIRQIGSTGDDQILTLTKVNSTNFLVGGKAAGLTLGVSVVGATDALVLPVTTDGTVGVPSMINVASIDSSDAVAVTSTGVVVVAGRSETSSDWSSSGFVESRWTATIQNGVVATSVWQSENRLPQSLIKMFALDSDGRLVALGQRAAASGNSDTVRGTMQIVSDSGTLSSPISLSSSLVSQGTPTSGSLVAAVKNPDGKLLLISTNGFSEILSVPSAPTGLSAAPASRQVVLSWELPASGGGVPISDYRVKYRRVGDSIWTTFNDGVNLNRRAAVPLNPDYNYEFQVFAINGLGVGEATTTITSRPLAADSSWNFVYGSPGLFDYSVFLRSVPREDGSAYFLGQFSGDFEGFSAGSKYKPFVQYRNAAGQIQWTKEVLPEEQGCLVDFAFYQAFVDDLGDLYFTLNWCSSPTASDTSSTYIDLMSVTSDGDLAKLNQNEIYNDFVPTQPNNLPNLGASAYSYLWFGGTESSLTQSIKPAIGGGIEVLNPGKTCAATCTEYGILRKFNREFSQSWKLALPSEVLSDSLSLAVVSDGSVWIVGQIPKPLPHMNDAIALVHVSSSGTYLTTVKNYTFPCVRAEVSRVTVDSVWLWTCAKNSTTGSLTKSLNAFDPSNGSWFGEVPGTRHPDIAMYCPPDQCPIFNGFPMYTTFSPDGSYAYQKCFSGCSGDNQRDVFKIDGTGIDIRFTKLISLVEGVGETVEDVFVNDSGEIVEVGSTTSGVSNLSMTSRLPFSVGATRAFVRTSSIAESPSNPSNPSNPSPSSSFVSLAEPKRVVDTRGGGRFGTTSLSNVSVKRVKIAGATTTTGGATGLPASGIGAVALNVTAVEGLDAGGFGFVTVYPCDSLSTAVPNSSNLNFAGGQTIPNAVIAPVSADGYVCFSVYGNTDLLVDASGYFS